MNLFLYIYTFFYRNYVSNFWIANDAQIGILDTLHDIAMNAQFKNISARPAVNWLKLQKISIVFILSFTSLNYLHNHELLLNQIM